MKTLHLLRHAKSDRDDPRLKDHDRPLAKRGIKAAKLMAEQLAKLRVDQVYCSTSRRTRETYALVEPSLGKANVSFERGLYLAGVESLLEFIHALPTAADAVLLVGHNPGFHNLALSLVALGRDSPELEALREKFPTGTLCTMEFPGTWKDIEFRTARLVRFVRPRELE